MAKHPGGRNIISAVRETLDSVVSPSVRDAILSRALNEAQKNELPTEPAELDDFVQGPLHDSLVRSLGPELGMSVATELERIVSLASKDAAARSLKRPETVRPGRTNAQNVPTNPAKRRASRSTLPSRGAIAASNPRASDETWVEQQRRGIAPTMPAGRSAQSVDVSVPPPAKPLASLPASPTSADYPAGTARALGVIGTVSVEPRSSGRPIVYIASTDGDLLRSFQAWLDARAIVEPIAGATTLLRRMSDTPNARSVVVLDGKHPAIRPLTLAALAEELPPKTTVLLWGVPPHVHARMCTVASAAEKWLVAAGDTTSEEIVARCANLFR